MLPSDPDVVIIGAGCAGIAAARTLTARGRHCVVLEAGSRVGGRAFTDGAELGVPVDLGATWLHLAAVNPLTRLAEGLGFERLDHDSVRQRLLWMGERFATEAERHGFAEAERAFERAVLREAAMDVPDRSVADVMPRDGIWAASVAHWQGAQISAAEVEKLSLRDYAATLLGGPNLRLRAGIGTLLARLAQGLPMRLNAAVTRLSWGGADVIVEGGFGTLRTKAAIVTVSTAVLTSGAIAFDPPLPVAVQDATRNLPLGLLTKFAFRAAGADRLDLPDFAGLRRRVANPGDRPMSWIAWPFGEPVIEGFVGGARASELSREGPAATEAAAREELARIFGARAIAALGKGIVSRWGDDPRFGGSYTHARPGHADARRTLAAPLGGGRLRFAGEACDSRFAGTLAGAWNSGEQAAMALAPERANDDSDRVVVTPGLI